MPTGPEGGTTVLFRHEGWSGEYPDVDYARVCYTWARIVGALKDFVETGQSQPFLG